ncbi:MAG: histone deacetylase [Pseudanabaena sp.]|nr:MAG: histone deacetylase [Pseudanabaena sp.]
MKQTINSITISPKVVYSQGYDIQFLGLEKLHPFDSCKYSRTWRVLADRFGDRLIANSLAPLSPVTSEMLQVVHTTDYLKNLHRSHFVAKSLELDSLGFLPISILDSRVLKPMRLATTGTIMASEAALEFGIAINLSGGYHHASAERGEGFCIYSDIAIAIYSLRQSQKIHVDDRVAIVDLDAHQGNGLARIFYDDPSVRILDMYNQQIYPNDNHARERVDCSIPLLSGTKDDRYLGLLKDRLPAFLREKELPKIVFYNAGTDIYERDLLGGLKISERGILERDRFVFQTVSDLGIPLVMVLSGGYAPESYRLIADSISDVLQTWNN